MPGKVEGDCPAVGSLIFDCVMVGCRSLLRCVSGGDAVVTALRGEWGVEGPVSSKP